MWKKTNHKRVSYRHYLSPGKEDLLSQSENHASIPSVILPVHYNRKMWIHYHVGKSVRHTQEVVQIHADRVSEKWRSDRVNIYLQPMEQLVRVSNPKQNSFRSSVWLKVCIFIQHLKFQPILSKLKQNLQEQKIKNKFLVSKCDEKKTTIQLPSDRYRESDKQYRRLEEIRSSGTA